MTKREMLDRLEELAQWYSDQVASVNSEYKKRMKELQEQYALERICEDRDDSEE